MSESAISLAPWIVSQAQNLLAQRGHAWLLAGPSGLGQYDLAMTLVRAWLCDHPGPQGACCTCPSCHAIDVRTHADFFVLMPQTNMQALGWQLSDKPEEEKAPDDTEGKKQKLSKEIKVESMREAVEFSQRTSARSRGKAVLVYPAERMNVYTANALLKTLEEPPGDVKFVLATDAAHLLLPTIRSRCLTHAMMWPDQSVALAWLESRGMTLQQAQVMLRAAGGRPQDALQFSGLSAVWPNLPRAVQNGDVSAFKDWTGAQIVDALHKLCHDLQALRCGALPRFFEQTDLPRAGSWKSLTGWGKTLAHIRRTVEHPYNAALMQEALISQAQWAMASKY